MKRDYSTGESESVTYFVGKEVEKTPAFGMQTLFVVGVHPVDDLEKLARKHNCNHIYLGANHSYKPEPEWDVMALGLLKKKFWVSLDFDVSHWEWVLECLGDHNPQFIPIVSVKLPYNSQANYNTVIKIDDKDFNSTCDGVWSHMLHDLKDRSKFTQWTDYKNDEPVGGTNEEV